MGVEVSALQMTSEKISDEYLEINSCNVQHLTGKNYRMLRPEGRVDYHILYIAEGFVIFAPFEVP